jgi:hypothetical protein
MYALCVYIIGFPTRIIYKFAICFFSFNFTPSSLSSSEPHPLYPPLLKRRGGRDFREGAKPPLITLPLPLTDTKGRG